MFYIIGLGNPGSQYTFTRHNVAWIIFDEIFDDKWTFNKYMNADIQHSNYGLSIKPQTLMNKSGEVITFLEREVDFNPEHIIVVYDDIDLPFGTIRISQGRGDGGHNGLKSVVNHLGSKECIRIRIGISKMYKGELVKPNVLGLFSKENLIFLKENIAPQIERIITSITTEGVKVAMNRYNSK